MSEKQDRKIGMKKPQIVIDNFKEFIPEFLILLNQQKQKSIIRVGKNYQAVVPAQCSYSYLYKPLNHLKVWSKGDFSEDVFKKFKEKFG
jgi:hypothetical protein